MTVDGFGAATWEKYAQSQGFGIIGPGGGGGGSANREPGSYMATPGIPKTCGVGEGVGCRF